MIAASTCSFQRFHVCCITAAIIQQRNTSILTKKEEMLYQNPIHLQIRVILMISDNNKEDHARNNRIQMLIIFKY